MSKVLRHLLVAVAAGAVSTAAFAQYTQPTAANPPSTQTQKATGTEAKADSDLQMAEADCKTKPGALKDSCLHDAKAAHDRAISGDKPQTGATPQTGSTPSK